VQPTWTVACFALSVDAVDALIEAVGQGLTKQPRWIVFSDDMPKLGALATYWEPFADVVIVMFPGMSTGAIDAAESVLEAESAVPCSTIWVQPLLQVASCPPAISRCLTWEAQSTEELASHIVAILLNP
jgi:hypothetical protein